MTFVSKLTLATALSLSAFALTADPASAQRRGQQQEQQQLEMSEDFREPAAEAQAAVEARNWDAAEAPLARAEAAADNPDEQYFAAWMRLQVATGKDDDEGVIRALDTLIASPRVPAENQAALNYERGRRAIVLDRRAEAIPFLLRARELGSTSANLPLLLASSYLENDQVSEGIAELERAIQAEEAAGRKAPEDWYNLAVAKLYGTGDRAATAGWLMRQVEAYPTIPNWRRVLILYHESNDSAGAQLGARQKIDLYRLMRASGALADERSYYEYADAAVNAGLPWEAVTVIEEGRAGGSIASNEPTFNQIYTQAQRAVRNEQALSTYERQATAAANGELAAQTGDAYLASGNDAKAIELYQLALEKGGVDTDVVNLRLGIAQARSGNETAAKQSFAQVSGTGATADIARFWTTWIDLPELAPAPASEAAAQPAATAN